MTTAAPIATEPVLTDADIQTLNQARTILKALSNRSATASWNAPLLVTGEPNAADYGRVHALADVAENSIFTVLNWANIHHVRPLTDAQIHNKTDQDDTAEM